MSFPFRFGPCWLDSVLAGGQSSLLFLARPATEDAARTGRALVVKVPYLYLQRSSGFRQMFYERMHALVGLSATDLVTPEVSGRTSGLVWVASPYVEGWDADRALAAVQRGGSRPSPRQVLTLGVRLAEALAGLHEAPSEYGAVVHGEIRPGKLLFERDGQPRLLLASAITAASGERSSASSAERFAWRAPEQLLRQPETARTDVRGLALLLFVLVTGSNPFQRRTTARTCSAILQDQVLFEGDAQLSGGLSALLRAAMSSDPERRPASMRALASALRGELDKLGGEEPWTPWLDALRARGDAAPEPASNPERDALIARLLRDAPRTAEPPPEPHHHAPGAARAPAPPEPRPQPAPPAAPPRPPPAYEQEPTELLPTTPPAPKAPAPRPSSEVSGFTLVPDDAGSEAAVPGAVNLNDLLRHQLPPEALETPDPTEATEEYTEEYTEATEEVEDKPTNPSLASHLQADTHVDSSFVLVTDELPADAGLMLAPEAAGSKETIPEGLRYTPIARDDEEEGLLPAMSAEEGMAELERERAARGEDVERDDEETEELPTPMDEELPQSATIRVGPPWEEGPAVVSAPRPPASAPAEPTPAEPSPETVTTLPDHALSQPEPTLPPPEPTPPPPEPARPPRPVATAPERPTPPRPETPKPPRTVVAPPSVSEPRVIKPPPVEMRPKPPWDTSKPGGGGKYAAIGLVVLLGLAGAIYASGVLKPDPARPAPPEKTATTSTAPVADPSTEAPTTTTEPIANTEQTTEPTTEQTAEPTTEQTTEPTTGPTTEQATADATPETSPAQTTPRTPKPPPVSEGPPGLTALKSDATDTRVTLRGSMRGSFARPTMTVQPGGGTNGFDLYVLTFRGIESQMKLTRVNVTSAFVSGVQIVSSKDLLELRVSVAPGSNVSYSKVSDGFSITVNQPRTGG